MREKRRGREACRERWGESKERLVASNLPVAILSPSPPLVANVTLTEKSSGTSLSNETQIETSFPFSTMAYSSLNSSTTSKKRKEAISASIMVPRTSYIVLYWSSSFTLFLPVCHDLPSLSIMLTCALSLVISTLRSMPFEEIEIVKVWSSS